MIVVPLCIVSEGEDPRNDFFDLMSELLPVRVALSKWLMLTDFRTSVYRWVSGARGRLSFEQSTSFRAKIAVCRLSTSYYGQMDFTPPKA
ncbi:hypothetical protein [Sphingobium yanoikuyae]|uniref:hypothetical protein n=1 Tax=Sphingobium yanoikuyae TaxID=13690 RepID=UPI0028B18ACC|nr:hypothetical protein [Sphingobium yanoikuyae]